MVQAMVCCEGLAYGDERICCRLVYVSERLCECMCTPMSNRKSLCMQLYLEARVKEMGGVKCKTEVEI